MTIETRTMLVRHLSACSVHSLDHHRVRLARAPWDDAGEARPDLRPETAPRQRMPHVRPMPSRGSAPARAELFRQILAEARDEVRANA